MGAETLSNTLGEVKIKALVDNVADWPSDLKSETLSVYLLI